MVSYRRIVIVLLITSGWFAVVAALDLDFVNATVIDGTGAPPRAGASVIVRSGRIEQILERAPPVDGVRRIDLQRRFLLPGLIDAHAHIESLAAALGAMQSGVTTARSLGIDARTGTIRPGLEADLLVVERDRLRDGSAPFEPLLVVSDGRVAFERRRVEPQ